MCPGRLRGRKFPRRLAAVARPHGALQHLLDVEAQHRRQPLHRPVGPPHPLVERVGHSFADWVDWLVIELTFVELYESAPPALKHEMTTAVRRLARGIGEAEIDAFGSQVPNFERALSSFPVEEQSRFAPQLNMAVSELAHHFVKTFAERD